MTMDTTLNFYQVTTHRPRRGDKPEVRNSVFRARDEKVAKDMAVKAHRKQVGNPGVQIFVFDSAEVVPNLSRIGDFA